ncbi:hypothetical protein EWF20_07410 [Sulfolobus sp. S-194]|uniref:hypothetical protein n=1 Tax=Sulfolobus sp. S-194 TaxID=2512240 RepID=UPI001436CEE9|nr:hypothetical protein [Sulfolobus sp. S-194]QIW23995.1 hypothetical protein EWF20_07410 [Sulfolobus sp. S-194]
MNIDGIVIKNVLLRLIISFIEIFIVKFVLPTIFSSSVFNFLLNVSILAITLTITQIIVTEIFIVNHGIFSRSLTTGSLIILIMTITSPISLPYSSFIVKLLLIIIVYLEMLISILVYILAEQFMINKYKPAIITNRNEKLTLILVPLIIILLQIWSSCQSLILHSPP